jgi:hypothetical protein
MTGVTSKKEKRAFHRILNNKGLKIQKDKQDNGHKWDENTNTI